MDYEHLRAVVVGSPAERPSYDEAVRFFSVFDRVTMLALLDERDRLAAEVVVLREALAWLVARPEVAGHQNDDLLQRLLAGANDIDMMAWLNGIIAARAALTNPSPAVAEVLRLVEVGRKVEAAAAKPISILDRHESAVAGGRGGQKMVRVESRPFHFRCDCGGNVFTNVVELDTYECNACGVVYQGER